MSELNFPRVNPSSVNGCDSIDKILIDEGKRNSVITPLTGKVILVVPLPVANIV